MSYTLFSKELSELKDIDEYCRNELFSILSETPEINQNIPDDIDYESLSELLDSVKLNNGDLSRYLLRKAFSWGKSPQGLTFWEDVHEKLPEMSEEVHIQLFAWCCLIMLETSSIGHKRLDLMLDERYPEFNKIIPFNQ